MSYEEIKETIWVIKVTDPDRYACWGPNITYSTAISIDTNIILTLSNNITDKCTVFGRRLHENDFLHDLETVHFQPSLGQRLLKCKIQPLGDFPFAKISDDEILNDGDEVVHISGDGLYLTGHVSYPCVKVDPSTFNDSRVCNDVSVMEESMYESLGLSYRTMGDFVNDYMFSKGYTLVDEMNGKLHPNLPVVQCFGIPVVQSDGGLIRVGSFGGAVFRKDGREIVGIVSHGYERFCMCVHLSAVKAFLDEAKSLGCGELDACLPPLTLSPPHQLSSPLIADACLPPLTLSPPHQLSSPLIADFDQVKKTIWVIQVLGRKGCSSGPFCVITYLAGVSIDQNCILTCAKGITDKCKVLGRRLHEKGFIHELETGHVREDWGLRMLKRKNEPVGEFECGKISDDEMLKVLSEVSHFGHPLGLPGSYFVGSVSYPCVKVDPSTFLDSSLVCKDYRASDCHMWGSILKMGDFVNMRAFSEGDAEDTEFNRRLNPMVPVVQYNRIPAVTGCFGGPIYRDNGEIFGVVTHNFGGFCTGGSCQHCECICC